ncbi:HD domain-containing protein [Anseongella ginsenosidimutans]|uniref:HD domain-containing protein n=1 Tax=Anseongella ginsenosidimutans TaxID=496056 RepID=A0A4R3KRY5_9SPHI|nr:HD domain-containing protein [Anseongella ginsenosidimutans]QEC52886.1 bifunctional (p)ppGpp synthetase/guanosine-3',5'-bis(diphosphate) 3'-pyrophosphohydrolase [Anseongella ginsenosidimutans]TCS87277.1 HD domain-containing protein [Anseongella ginsenosidimutans]
MDAALKEIEDFAGKAHGAQRRKYKDEPYIVHPVRVMNICREYTASQPVLAAALLHDVLEDTPVRKKEIKAFLEGLFNPAETAETVMLVDWLTDIYTKDAYPKLNRKKRKVREAERLTKAPAAAQTVKYADIIDNAGDIAANDADFAKVFLRECRQLLKKMDQGDPRLYRRAEETVENCLNSLRR